MRSAPASECNRNAFGCPGVAAFLEPLVPAHGAYSFYLLLLAGDVEAHTGPSGGLEVVANALRAPPPPEAAPPPGFSVFSAASPFSALAHVMFPPASHIPP
eukprot:892142-Pleurochrysis_carterae.AAC.2